MSEQNRTKSAEIDLTATIFYENGGDIDSFDGEIISISPGSIGLRVDRPISQDSRIQVMLTFIDPEGERHQESVQGWLVWQDEMPPFYRIGVIFPEINERVNPSLVSYLWQQEQQGELKASGDHPHKTGDCGSGSSMDKE
jgi:hypothetical protein